MTIYHATSLDAFGEVIQTCSSQTLDGLAEVARHPDAVGPVIIEDAEPPENSYRLNGAWVATPAQPSPLHQWLAAEHRWVDARTIEQRQEDKWAEMKARRTEIEFGPFTYNGMEFDGDVDAQRRLGGCVSEAKSAIAAGVEYSTPFILADNSVVTLSAVDVIGAEAAKISSVRAAFVHAAQLRALIFSTLTEAELDAIDWSSV